ncbi:hypothetical protein KIN20_008043 [Parelaphostrongylus tenuis]|uniref:Uncharacterized protein n=1 Tax=Parelaphostrongylus tenuis TaxID=148309 RepID=A0AAD5QJK0_PARTN|nr:hypothetical protein KIN20_008043 [Parelaphostrongylus tenuis]
MEYEEWQALLNNKKWLEFDSDSESISSVSDIVFSDIDNIVVSDGSSTDLEEGEVVESGGEEADENSQCKILTFDQGLIRRLMTEEEFRIDPALARLPEQKEVIQIVSCFDYHKSKDGVIRSTRNHEMIVGSFKSMLNDIQSMKKERPKLDSPERILMHSCWKCARREGKSSSESSISSSSSGKRFTLQ